MGTQELRPRKSLLVQGFLSWLAFLFPLFIVLYFVTAASGPWISVISLLAIVTALIAASGIASSRVFVRSDTSGVTERGFFGRHNHVPSAVISKVLLLSVFHGGSLETAPQLFLCDAEGRLLLRMRGQFWSRSSMEQVAAATRIPVTRVDEPLTSAELRAEYPQLLYWFERHPLLARVGIGAGFLALSAIVYGILVLSDPNRLA